MLELCEAIEGLATLLEAESAADRRKKRQRHLAIALGLIGQGTLAARAAALELPKKPARRLRRTIDVAAYRTIGPRGALRDPVPVAAGDTLYIAPTDRPGAGIVSKDASGPPYATARAALAAGGHASLSVTLWEKLWLTDGNPCDICEENSIAGWIPMDEDFPSGHSEPDAHPNCKCDLEMRAV